MTQKKIILFALSLTVLLALQIKFLLPWMYDIAASDLFLVESKDSGDPMPVNNDMTALAFSQCNSYINSNLDSEYSASFASQPTNAWGIGNYEYIFNAPVEITTKDTPTTVYTYVCRIQYDNGDDLSGVNDLNNWTIGGITGIPDF
ncbi:MAG: hypothetical protein PHR94_03885 [Methylomonas lenta]|nr:hypothetical protein [Methylomonas lenta]